VIASTFFYVGALFSTLVLVLELRGIGVLGFGPQGSSGVFMVITVLVAGAFMFLGGYVSDRRGRPRSGRDAADRRRRGLRAVYLACAALPTLAAAALLAGMEKPLPEGTECNVWTVAFTITLMFW